MPTLRQRHDAILAALLAGDPQATALAIIKALDPSFSLTDPHLVDQPPDPTSVNHEQS